MTVAILLDMTSDSILNSLLHLKLRNLSMLKLQHSGEMCFQDFLDNFIEGNFDCVNYQVFGNYNFGNLKKKQCVINYCFTNKWLKKRMK